MATDSESRIGLSSSTPSQTATLPTTSDPSFLAKTASGADDIALVEMPDQQTSAAQPEPPSVGIERRETRFQQWTRRQTAKVQEAGVRKRNLARNRDSSLHVDSGDYETQRRRNSVVDLEMVSRLLKEDQLDLDTHGVSEVRDGWFDAIFLEARPLDYASLMWNAKSTLPAAFDKTPPLSIRHFFPNQRRQLESLFWRVTTTRSGVRLLRAFLAFFISYALCLIPQVREWLGRYSYIMVISTIINHPARPFGAQLDGTVFTILGTVAGLGWGVLGLLLSYSTLSARLGYGGILALFFLAFMATVAFLRSYFARFYQFAMCAGIAMCYTLLADVDSEGIDWPKFFSYGVPWVLGQAISFIVNLLFFDGGARPLAEALHRSFLLMQDALELPRPRNQRLRRGLTRSFVDVGIAYRDLRLDVSISRFDPDDVRSLRNLMQGVIRSLLLLKTESRLFDEWDTPVESTVPITVTAFDTADLDTSFALNVEGPEDNSKEPVRDGGRSLRLVAQQLASPTREMLVAMRSTVLCCDAACMDMSGYRRHLGPSPDVSSDVSRERSSLSLAIRKFDDTEANLRQSKALSFTTFNLQEVAKLIVFAQHVRMAGTAIDSLATKIADIQPNSRRLKLFPPSYPFNKAVNTVNAQTRRDGGGQTAGIYKETFKDISILIEKIKSREHQPVSNSNSPERVDSKVTKVESAAALEADEDPAPVSKRSKLGYKIWLVLHRLQGFESKYAVKVCLLTALLAVPAWLEQSSGWWNETESWWAVVMAWLMVHPRVGGNMQDLVVRGFCVALGALWAGLAYVAHSGNPFVMAAFAIVYMLPMLYRYTQSTHPRSGLAGCLSFAVISLSLVTSDGGQSPAFIAATRGLAFLVGTVSAILVNWILWPFISRHELRKAISAMLFFQSVIYRNVVAKYLYYDEEREPTKEDIEHSEMIEGRVREGFVRIRQLLIMTRHELRLRGPFDPLPYSALADACERFFEHLIAVRQAAMHHDPGFIRDNDAAAEKLLPYRRDAVASILSNLYILSGALKAGRKVPRYLPNAAAARKRLLDRMVEVEEEQIQADRTERGRAASNDGTATDKWAHVYGYAFNESLTGCVAQLDELERYTKLIVGELGFDDEYKDSDSSSDSSDDGLTNRA